MNRRKNNTCAAVQALLGCVRCLAQPHDGAGSHLKPFLVVIVWQKAVKA